MRTDASHTNGHAAQSTDRSTGTTPQIPHPLLHEVTGAGDPVVLMPGGLSGWLSWVAPAERLAQHHMVVRAQLRSIELIEADESLPKDYAVETEREALLATVDTLGLDQVDLVGWSAGGAAALAFALEHPERVRTLTLIEPAAFWVLREAGHTTDAYRQVEAVDRALADREVTVENLRAFLVYAGLGTSQTDFEANPRWPVWVRNRQALAANAAEWDYRDSLDRLRSLKVPLLLIRGTGTAEVLAAVVDAIVATAPNATLLELPGGHACHLEHPDRFLAALEAHLDRA